MDEGQLGSARARYEARDYAAVVGMLADVPRLELLTSPERAFMLADSARRVGDTKDLLPLVNATVDAAREQKQTQVLLDSLNLQGVLLLETGHARAAERAWFDLVNVATQCDNPQYVARASNNLGVTATLAMRLEQAIDGFQRAIRAYSRLGYHRGLSQSHHNLGIVYRELDQEQQAHAHFHRAITFARTGDLMDDLARAEEELALVWLYISRDAARARSLVEIALGRFAELKQPAGAGNAQRVNGLIALFEGNLTEADASLQEALRIARDRSLRLLEAETLLGLATLEHQRQAEFKENTMREHARRIFFEIGAAPWGEQVQRRMKALTA